MCIVNGSFFYSLLPRSLISYCKTCCWGERRMSIIERRLHDRKEKWVLNIIGNIFPWYRVHTVPTFDGQSYGLSIFFIIQWERLHLFIDICERTLERYISKFLVIGRVKPGQLAVCTAVSVLRHAKNSSFLHTKYRNHRSFRSCNLRSVTTAISRSV